MKSWHPLHDTRRDFIRLVLASGLLLALILLYLRLDGITEPAPAAESRASTMQVQPALPKVDRELVARGGPPALAHLLELSLNLSSSTAELLRAGAQPTAREVASDVTQWCGRYLVFDGELMAVHSPRSTHPVAGYQTRSGQVQSDHQAIDFHYSLANDLPPGSPVRVGGFVLGTHQQALLLVGAELQFRPRPWPPVQALDPEILARVRDGRLGANGVLIDFEAMERGLEAEQEEPLWHLAAYALERARKASAAELATIPSFEQVDQWRSVEAGTTAKGAALRVIGRRALLRVIPAKPNPLGVTHWTEVWLQLAEMHGRVVPIWLPNRLAEIPPEGSLVVADSLLFKRMKYVGSTGRDLIAPVFVAANLRLHGVTR